MKFLELYASAVIMWFVYYETGKILFGEEKVLSFTKLTILIIVYSFLLASLNIIDSEIFHGIIKITISYLMICSYYKILFSKELSKIIISSFLTYLTLLISEVLIAIIISIVFKIMNIDSVGILKNTIFINMLVCCNTLITVKIFKIKFKDWINNTKINYRSTIAIIVIVLLTISLLGFKIPVNLWQLNVEFIVTMFILLCFCIIGIFIIKQKSDIQKTTFMYQKLVDYSNIMNNLLEDYRVVLHEQKNQLLIIRGMINDSNKELLDYVDNLLDKRVNSKYEWIGQLNYLTLQGLKGLINYKLMEMKSLKINADISISKEISKIRLSKLSTRQKDNLYSIIGIYLDNAIQAAKDSKEKEISLEIYKEKKDIVMILANTYSGTLELDKMDNYGYTTKGKNHGVGLHIVKKILTEDETFSQSRSLFENYYVQELRIHLNKNSI